MARQCPEKHKYEWLDLLRFNLDSLYESEEETLRCQTLIVCTYASEKDDDTPNEDASR